MFSVRVVFQSTSLCKQAFVAAAKQRWLCDVFVAFKKIPHTLIAVDDGDVGSCGTRLLRCSRVRSGAWKALSVVKVAGHGLRSRMAV